MKANRKHDKDFIALSKMSRYLALTVDMVTISTPSILHENAEIGRFVCEENHIQKLEIKPEYQNNGYGTEVIKLYLEDMATQQYDQVTTTPVTSPTMGHILEKIGFRQVEEPTAYDFLPGDVDNQYLACYIYQFHRSD